MKDVLGYEGLYRVSNDGKVYSVRKGRLMAIHKNFRGYFKVTLRKNGKNHFVMVSRLVLEAHGPGRPSTKHFCNHKNGIKTDNRIENLEWATAQENNRHALDLGLRKMPNGLNHWKTKLNPKQVKEIRKATQSLKSLAREFGVDHTTIRAIKTGKTWRHL